MLKQLEDHIHVEWEGPYTYSEALKQTSPKDYGVYQIYGSHPVYGSDVLVYIGKADAQTFGKRLSQHWWAEYNQDGKRIKVYLGRLHGYAGTPEDETWSKQISFVERLLIYAHWPAANSSGLNVSLGKDLHYVHVFNWGHYRDLLPEVSGARYSDRYESEDGFLPYSAEEASSK